MVRTVTRTSAARHLDAPAPPGSISSADCANDPTNHIGTIDSTPPRIRPPTRAARRTPISPSRNRPLCATRAEDSRK